ncbi:MAG TPA: thioesterase family protein [Candidatus Polarisedimenticolia bacterium]|jgi:acyl-CoA thioester hydrolase|nr:thioesterase family protein [Candidatus Polarisedimenticolia bacterium]
MKRGITSVRVRYPEVDRMGVAHHSHFLSWFEMGRTELLRGVGCSYAEMESQGVFMPVVEVICRYRSPVRYDDLLEVETHLMEISGSRVTFDYRLRRQGEDTLLAEARTVHATVNREGQVIRIPAAYRDLLARP